MNWWSRLFRRGTQTQSQSIGDLRDEMRRKPERPNAYYAMSSLPNVSYTDSAEFYKSGLKFDRTQSIAFFSHHWAFALKAAHAQDRQPCIDAFCRALLCDAGQYAACRSQIDTSDAFALNAWECARAAIEEEQLHCGNCGHVQLKGEWEERMDQQAKARGSKGFFNLSARPQCLNCGSTDLQNK